MSANLDERTRFEMYYPPFEGAIEAGVGSVMCSYNKLNDTYSCENNSTLNTDLRERLGFKGYVMSDWGATHSVSIASGLDQEQGAIEADDGPGLVFTQDEVSKVPEALLNETVYRILYASAKTGVLNGTSVDNPGGFILKNVTNPEHKMIARELAEESMVLLSNRDNTLPLNLSETKSILMIGQHDQAMNPITGGGGSGSVIASWVVEPVNEIAKRLGIAPFQSNDNEV